MAIRVVFSGATGETMAMQITTQLGNASLRRIAGDEVQYASSPQCEIVKDETAGCWLLRHANSATNPTFLNGKLVDEATKITTRSVLTIGLEKMPLTITLEY